MASLQEIAEETKLLGGELSVVRHVAGQWSIRAIVERPRPLTDRANIFENTAYAPMEACRQASELLITSLAKLEPPVIITEEDVFLSVNADSDEVKVSATFPLESAHSIVDASYGMTIAP